MIVKTAIKQPREVKDYPVAYTDWLAENSPADTLFEVIDSSVECLSDEDDTALVIDDVIISDTGMVVWLSGGTVDAQYKVTVLLGTASTPQRKDECELIIDIVEY